jgi:hypothetical protein
MNEPVAKPETEYIVLERVELPDVDLDDPTVWRVIGKATVSGPKDRAVDEVTKGRDGTFKAVSARAWRGGKTNTTETVTKSTPFED